MEQLDGKVQRTIDREGEMHPPLKVPKSKSHFFYELYNLFHRATLNFFRTPLMFRIRIMQVFFLAIFFSLLFYRFEPIDG